MLCYILNNLLSNKGERSEKREERECERINKEKERLWEGKEYMRKG